MKTIKEILLVTGAALGAMVTVLSAVFVMTAFISPAVNNSFNTEFKPQQTTADTLSKDLFVIDYLVIKE